MRFLKNQPWNQDPAYEEVMDEVEWNLWSIRQSPFNLLEEGDRVFLTHPVARGGSTVSWEVEVTRVVTARYRTHREAWDILRRDLPVVRKWTTWADFRDQDYTRQAPVEGWILGWSYDPVRPVGVLRPKELRFRPNGWLSLEPVSETKLEKWGLISGRGTPSAAMSEASVIGQGRDLDPVTRRIVERHALNAARRHLQRLGWKPSEITDTSIGHPYDLECRRGKRVLRVEVKGLTGALGSVVLTRREVEHARTTDTEMGLYVLSSITIRRDNADVPKATGGSPSWWPSWDVDDGILTAEQFRYKPPLTS